MANYFDQFDTPVASIPAGGNFFDQFDKPEEKGLFTRIGEDLTKRGANQANITADKQAGKISDTGAALDIVGNQFGAAGDIAGQTIASAVKTGFEVLPDSAQMKVKSLAADALNSAPGKAIMQGAEYVGNKWDEFKGENPLTARRLGSLANIAIGAPMSAKAVEGAASALKTEVPLTAANRKLYAGALYDDATAKGGALKPEVWEHIAKRVDASMPHEMSLDPSPSLFGGIKQIVEANKTKPITLDGLEAMDKSLTDLITGEYKAKKGASGDAVKLQELQRDLRDMAYNPSREMVKGDDAGFSAYQNGVKEWAIAKRKEDIENILTRAEHTDNPSTSIRRQFARIYEDKKLNRGYNKEQMAFIKKAAESSKFADFLRTTAGSRLITGMIGGMAGATTGTPLGAILGAAGGATASAAARGAATSLKKGQVNKLVTSIEKGSNVPRIPKEIYALPPEEAKIAIRKIMNGETK